ncbi:hypothetical protein PR048_007064 [Dryococelus australis]|uniref:Uncharacterized protein n=1 Tax=Dryococelus australis TaxID=614101 RepID=A0ABQ9ID61_9NEOP|nr:hypothetical protein PR048_007064 [Dryococelus australis]
MQGRRDYMGELGDRLDTKQPGRQNCWRPVRWAWKEARPSKGELPGFRLRTKDDAVSGVRRANSARGVLLAADSGEVPILRPPPLFWAAEDGFAEHHLGDVLSVVSGRAAPGEVKYEAVPERRGREKQEIPEKIQRPAASSGTIPTCEIPGATPRGIEPGSPCWAAGSLTTTSPRHLKDSVIPTRAYFFVLHQPKLACTLENVLERTRYSYLVYKSSICQLVAKLRKMRSPARVSRAPILRARKPMRMTEVSMEQLRQPAASSGTIPTYGNLGVTPLGIEPCSPIVVELPVCFEDIEQIGDVDYSAAANETMKCDHLFIRQGSLSFHCKTLFGGIFSSNLDRNYQHYVELQYLTVSEQPSINHRQVHIRLQEWLQTGDAIGKRKGIGHALFQSTNPAFTWRFRKNISNRNKDGRIGTQSRVLPKANPLRPLAGYTNTLFLTVAITSLQDGHYESTNQLYYAGPFNVLSSGSRLDGDDL